MLLRELIKFAKLLLINTVKLSANQFSFSHYYFIFLCVLQDWISLRCIFNYILLSFLIFCFKCVPISQNVALYHLIICKNNYHWKTGICYCDLKFQENNPQSSVYTWLIMDRLSVSVTPFTPKSYFKIDVAGKCAVHICQLLLPSPLYSLQQELPISENPWGLSPMGLSQ